MVVVREVAEREVADSSGQGGVGHIGAGIILSASCLALTLFSFMFEVKSFYCFSS